MRIISKTHDYYDCLIDPSDTVNIWTRPEPKIISRIIPYHSYYNTDSWLSYNNQHLCIEAGKHYMLRIVGFCGKLYPCIEYTNRNLQTTDYFYDLKDIEIPTRKRLLKSWKKPEEQLKDFAHSFELIKKYAPAMKIFTEFKVPYFVRTRSSIILVPNLKDIKFYRKLDVYQTFQEIEMYLFGVLGQPNKPIPDVPDKVMAEAKGFDKWSFRKESTKK